MEKKSIKSIAKRLTTARAQIREQADETAYLAANDLFKDLEMRWGPGFAQWVVDGLTEEATK